MRAVCEDQGVNYVTFVALVAACFIIAVSVAATVGAITYAGWIEPGSERHSDACSPP
jgi:hypothetical protein